MKTLEKLTIRLPSVDHGFFPILAKTTNLTYLEFTGSVLKMSHVAFCSKINLLTSLKTSIFERLKINPLKFISIGSFPRLRVLIIWSRMFSEK